MVGFVSEQATKQEDARRAEATRVQAELKNRVMKAIPFADPMKTPKPDEFFLASIGQMNEQSAELVLREPATHMDCRGVVYFGNTGARGVKTFDELIVVDCHTEYPPARMYRSKMLVKEKYSNMY